MDFTQEEALHQIFCTNCVRGSTLERSKYKYQKGELKQKAIDKILLQFGYLKKTAPVYCKQIPVAGTIPHIKSYPHIKHIVDTDTFIKILAGKALDIKFPYTDFYKKIIAENPQFIRFMIDEKLLPDLYIDCHLSTISLSVVVGEIMDKSHSKTNVYYYLKQQNYAIKRK